MKILIIRFSSIGDIVLTTPVIRCLKKQVPNVEIHYCTKSSYQTILDTNPYIDKLYFLGDNLNLLITDLKKENYDYVIDLHNNLRTRIIKWKLGIKSFSFDKLNIQKWLLVNFKINILPKVHIVDRYLATVANLGIINDQEGLDFFLPSNSSLDVTEFEIPKNFVVFAIGGQHFTKRLPAHKISECCSKINQPIVLIGGQEDLPEANRVLELSQQNVILNLCGRISIAQSAELIKNSQYVLTHDTGMMHIAAAFKKKIYVIWGNTIPDFGMYPYHSPYENIENTHINCRPCSKIGFEKCPKSHFKCMNDIKFDQKF